MSRVLYPDSIKWRNQEILVQVISEPLRPFQLDILKREIQSGSLTSEYSIISALRIGTASLGIIQDSILLASLKMCDTCPVKRQVLAPLWKSFEPMDFGDEIGVVQSSSKFRVRMCVEDSIMFVRVMKYVDKEGTYKIEVGKAGSESVWDHLTVLGANNIAVALDDPDKFVVKIQWDRGGAITTLKAHIAKLINYGVELRRCTFEDR